MKENRSWSMASNRNLREGGREGERESEREREMKGEGRQINEERLIKQRHTKIIFIPTSPKRTHQKIKGIAAFFIPHQRKQLQSSCNTTLNRPRENPATSLSLKLLGL